jgi:hypothetical protein
MGGDSVLLLLLEFPVRELREKEEEEREKKEEKEGEKEKEEKNLEIFSYLKIFGRKIINVNL